MFATSTFLQALFVCLIIIPMTILWVAAIVDVIRSGRSGLAIAAVIVLILVVPFLGPLLYFAFRKPAHEPSAEERHMLDEEMRREAARRPVGGTRAY